MAATAREWSEFGASLDGSLWLDEETRGRFASDESIYAVVPQAVVAPLSARGIAQTLRFAAAHGIGVTPRAGGTSLAGQAVGAGLVLDLSSRFEQIIDLDAAKGRVRVEPGVVLSTLNDRLAPLGKQFGPDPSSMESCRIGGMIANNASGVHHRMWGAVVDNVLSLTLMLSDGQVVQTSPIKVGSPEHASRSRADTLEGRIYREVPAIIGGVAKQMSKNWPRVEKSSSGYRLDKALAGGVFDLGKLVCGSEGTLAIVLDATLRVVDCPKAKGLLVLYFKSLEDAARGVKEVLATGPSAVEMIDERVVEALRSRDPAKAAHFKEGTKAALFVEYFADSVQGVEAKMAEGWRRLREQTRLAVDDQATTDPGTMEDLWRIRRGVEPLLSDMAGSRVPVGFVEDTAVPIERLAEHVRGLYAIFDRYGLKAAVYGHASQGHLHVRPFLDLRDEKDRTLMRKVAAEVFDQTRRLEGTMSGEHGDGLLRTEFLESFFWETYDAMVEIKRLFDPNGILNPGKKVGPEPGQMTKHLRAVASPRRE
jgi:FAD/FMN-containing dehydrogenase